MNLTQLIIVTPADVPSTGIVHC